MEKVEKGVPQGSKSAVLLFIVHMNDLPANIGSADSYSPRNILEWQEIFE